MAESDKQTSPDAVSTASDVLRDGLTSDKSKFVAASALSQAGSSGESKQTSDEVHSNASDVIQDDSTARAIRARERRSAPFPKRNLKETNMSLSRSRERESKSRTE